MFKVLITGGAGFIGTNLVEELLPLYQVIVVDNLSAGKRSNLLAGVNFYEADILEPDFEKIVAAELPDFIVHLAAQVNVAGSLQNPLFDLQLNITGTLIVIEAARKNRVKKVIYPSSAAVYGNETQFKEEKAYEKTLNIYGYSKLLFDDYIRYHLKHRKITSQVAGFRYFNVYGPRECHKGKMASVAYHHYLQYAKDEKVKLFGEHAGYTAGTHTRDFIYVGDIIDVKLKFWQNKLASGIYNLGTGKAEPFNNIAVSMVNEYRKDQGKSTVNLEELVKLNILEYINFPQSLHGKYQSYTQANLDNLRTVVQHDFLNVAHGVEKYYTWLKQNYVRFAE